MLNLRRWLPLVLFGLALPGQQLNLSCASQAGKDPRTFESVRKAYGELPISFEVNQGQTDRDVQFLARGQGYTLFLGGSEAVLALRELGKGGSAESGESREGLSTEEVLRVSFVGANPAALASGIERLPGLSNYFTGNDPQRWHTGVPNYRQVKCQGVYPGIDLVYYGTPGQLEYDLMIAPGAHPESVLMDIEGGTPFIGPQGDLVLKIGKGVVVFHKPQAYQVESDNPSAQHAVSAQYVLNGQHQVGFRLAGYDPTKTLVIDPVLSYSTYLGGNQGETAYGIALDAAGDAFIVGSTGSSNFPSVSPYQSSNKGHVDVFVTKLNSTGTSLLFSTYVGGTGYDAGAAIAVDAAGNAYVTGTTASLDFPVTPILSSTSSTAAFQTASGGDDDAFVAKLDPTGSSLLYSSYLGGSGADFGQAIAVDSLGDAYVTGSTQSTNFPIAYPFQGGNDGNSDAFVAKVNPAGTALGFSTYLGGSAADAGLGIAVDAAGRPYVTGYTFSTNFPMHSALQGANGGSADVFVAELDPDGLTLVFSTYLGGSGADRGRAIALDASGNVYVTGDSQSSNFPTTAGTLQSNNAGDGDAFVAKLGISGSSLVYSTLLGGTAIDQGSGIAVDSTGNAYVIGYTESSDFPRSSPVQAHFGGGTCGALPCPDAFVTELNPLGNALVYSTYLGGSGADFGQAICVDTNGYAYVAGGTASADFTPVAGAYQAAPGDTAGAGDAFVAKIDPANTPGVALTPQTVNFGNQAIYTSSDVQTVTLTNVGTIPLQISDITSTGDFTETDNCIGTIPPSGGFCTISITFTPTALLARTEVISITDNGPDSPQQITVNGTGVNPTTTIQLTPASLTFANQSVNSTSPTQAVTLTNTGNIPLTITDITVTGDYAQTNTCPVSPATLAAGANCKIFVAFSPTATGSRTGSVSTTDNAAGSPHSITLTGNGVSGFSLSVTNPSKIIMIGSTSTTFTISAAGPQTYTQSISLACASGATCSFSPSSITVGQSSTLTVSDLSASTANPFNFTVNGTSSDETETAVLSLTIFFADFTLSASPNLNSASAGQSATYKVTVTPSNGFNGSVLLSCSSGLPADASCVFTPSAVAPDGTSAVTATLTVTTTARSGIQPVVRLRVAPPPPHAGTVTLLLCGCLVALLLAAARAVGTRSLAGAGGRNGQRFRGRALVIVAMLLLMLVGLSTGCDNTISNLLAPTTGSGSQIGNYTITINGALGGGSSPVNRTTTVNLAVS